MPVTNIIDAVQQKYAALTSFTGKPAELWFGSAWPRKPNGSLVDFPFIRFTHRGTDELTTFEYAALETWPFTFEIYATTAQVCLTIFDRVRFNGLAPETAAGFRYAASMGMPDGYSFKSFEPAGRWSLDVRDGQASPVGSPIHVLEFPMDLHVHRLTFS